MNCTELTTQIIDDAVRRHIIIMDYSLRHIPQNRTAPSVEYNIPVSMKKP
jgi:hypothetical protein